MNIVSTVLAKNKHPNLGRLGIEHGGIKIGTFARKYNIALLAIIFLFNVLSLAYNLKTNVNY